MRSKKSGRVVVKTTRPFSATHLALRDVSDLKVVFQIHRIDHGVGDDLLARGWGVEEQRHLPITWHAVALIGIALGAGLLFATTRNKSQPD